ncbi:MAG: TrkH family potassium uptake protein [Clostridia bacterium]|nr:TrkH family potassium uptake protein [Clostridia bacterium]
MNIRAVLKLLGFVILMLGIFMIPPMVIAFCLNEKAMWAFLIMVAALSLTGFLLTRIKSDKALNAREGFATVALGWIVISLCGALPFFISGSIPSFIDSLFETASGFSTTGASILTDIESLPRSILYWRSFTNWLGGMGVLVFLLAVIPMSRGGSGDSFQLMRAESPGPSVGKITPTLRSSARILYLLYIGITVAEVIFLLCGGLPFFDSLTTALANAGTGGFSIRNASIAAYDSAYVQTVVTVFMILFGVNFNVFYLIIIRKFRQAFRNEELWVYFGIIAVSTVTILINIRHLYESFGKALLDSAFQVSSLITTTGFATADFDKWPEYSRALLVALMFIGACAGSTGGGMKISRLMLLAKSVKTELLSIVRQREVKPVKMDGKAVDAAVLRGTNAYFVAYALICVMSVIVVSTDGFDFETTTTAVISCLNNIGPGLGLVGPTGNYAAFSGLSKIILSLNMLIGRLEIFPILMLFSPSTWKK